MQLDTPFPLTPALSPGESENNWQSQARSPSKLPLLGERAGVRGTAIFELHGLGPHPLPISDGRHQ